MTRHLVDPHARDLGSDDLATWLLFFLESHGAAVTLTATESVRVNLDPMPGLDAETAHRWAPVITSLLPDFREILKARRLTCPSGAGEKLR
jgi:hypothetical protein